MGSYIIGSIFDIFSNCLPTTTNTESIHVSFKMASNILIYISVCWNFTSNNTIIQNILDYAKIR